MMTDQIKDALKTLEDGGVIAYPTDTTYGIGCDIDNAYAVNKIFEIKGRDFQKPLSIACSSLKMLAMYAEIDQVNTFFLDQIFPGPVTLLLKKKNRVSNAVTADSHKVGVRIPNHPEILELIENLGRPIITTSANFSGEADPISASELNLPVDFIFVGDCQYKKPSTIIDMETKRIVREGVNAKLYENLINKNIQK